MLPFVNTCFSTVKDSSPRSPLNSDGDGNPLCTVQNGASIYHAVQGLVWWWRPSYRFQVIDSSFALREAKGKISDDRTPQKSKRGQPKNHIFVPGRLWPGCSLMYHCCLADCGRAQKSNRSGVSKALKHQYKAFETMLLQETEPGAFWTMNPCCRQ